MGSERALTLADRAYNHPDISIMTIFDNVSMASLEAKGNVFMAYIKNIHTLGMSSASTSLEWYLSSNWYAAF